ADVGHPLDARQIRATASSLLEGISFPGDLSVSVPEGFAYYALHPLDYADLVSRSGIDVSRAVVVGIRSIGTTLTAVVAAKVHHRFQSSRIKCLREYGSPDENAGCPGVRPELVEGSRGFRDPGESSSMDNDSCVRRMTVRPTGHPYDRRCDLNQSQRAT